MKNQMLKRALTLFTLLPILAACAEEKQYGYNEAGYIEEGSAEYPYSTKARVEGQQRYMEKLGRQDYLSERKNWNTKLRDRKDQFNSILKREYLEFAGHLSAQKEYSDASYFRRKGLDAKYADFDLFPEDPADWDIKNDNDLENLRKARLGLLDSLVGYTPVVAPIASAKAIVNFDCWVQQSQKKSVAVDLNICRDKFSSNYKSIARISGNIRDRSLTDINREYQWVDMIEPVMPLKEVAAAPQKPGTQSPVKPASMQTSKTVAATNTKSPAKNLQPLKTAGGNQASMAYTPAKKQQPAGTANTTTSSTTSKITAPATTAAAAKPQPNLVGPAASEVRKIVDESNANPDLIYLSYFNGNESILTDQGKGEIDKAIAKIKEEKPASISVNGHTDRSANSTQSLVLSKARADAVKNYMVSKGVPATGIKTYGFGKTDNIIENSEGEAKPANNRAEIVFQGKAE